MNFLLIVSIFWVLSEIFLSRLTRANDSNNDYDKSSLKILWITICLSIILGIILRNPNFVLTPQYASFIYHIGISLICIGLIVRWMAILKLKKSFTVNVSVAANQTIVHSGIYKHIRHPSYLGSLLSFCGLGIVFNNWLTFIIIFIPIFSSFLYRIHIEEKLLSQVFGTQYRNYIKNSWKLIPKII
jgi:protein-S-isoprenylcysteine O-methyltransferase Ste14